MSDLEPARARIRVVLADDHPVVLAGIKAVLRSAPEIDLVGKAGDGARALRLVRTECLEVAVLDVSMPEIDGLDLTRRIAAEVPGVKVISLTVYEDRAYVQQLIGADARGYRLERSAAEDLVRRAGRGRRRPRPRSDGGREGAGGNRRDREGDRGGKRA